MSTTRLHAKRLSPALAGLWLAAAVTLLWARPGHPCQIGYDVNCYPAPPPSPCGPVPPTDNVCNTGYTCQVTSTWATWVPINPRGAPVHLPNGFWQYTSCNDSNNGTYNDICNSSGWCVGTPCPMASNGSTPNSCVSGFVAGSNPTTAAACQPTYQPAGTACSSGQACQYNETCQASTNTCGGGTAVALPPSEQCATYSCNYKAEPKRTAKVVGTACNAGNFCTSGDACDASGACAAGPAVVGRTCDDGNTTTTGDACDGASMCTGTSFLHLISYALIEQEPGKMTVTVPAYVTAGATFQFTVSLTDLAGGPLTTYAGTVVFSSTDGRATLPASYTFVAADAGQHTFSARLLTSQTTDIVVKDLANGLFASATLPVLFDTSTLQLSLSGVPSTVQAFQKQSVTVQASDGSQNTNYVGTIQFDSTDAWADLPADYTLSSGDNGAHTFVSQVEFRTVMTANLVVWERDTGVTAAQTGIVVTAPAVPACVLEAGGCCTDADCGGVLFAATCNVVERACTCQTGYQQCRGGCIPTASCCDHSDCPQPAHGGWAGCDNSMCTVHCPSGMIPHAGDCVSGCFPPDGDTL